MRKRLSGLMPIMFAVAVTSLVFAAPDTRTVHDSLGWRLDPLAWRWEGGRVFANSRGSSSAFWRAAPVCRKVEMEAVVSPRTILGEEWLLAKQAWKSAGIVIYANADAYWQLSLVEKPTRGGGGRSFELGQRWRGVWPSQKNLKQLIDESKGAWELGQALRFRLRLTQEKIEGWVFDAKGALLFHRAYQLTDDSARTGRPALRIGGMEAAFTDVKATWDEPVEESTPSARTAFPPYQRTGKPSGLKGKRTGFFHVEQIGGTWWTVDPEGAASVMRGIDHVKYEGSWCDALQTNPYGRENDKKYKSRDEWERQTLERLQSWGFNLLGAGCQVSLRGRGMAHCAGASLGNKFTALGGDCEICPNEKHPGSSFPNVFHPDFRAWCEYQLEEDCSAEANDPWLLGYFLDNELAWWGRRRDVTYGLFDAAMLKPAGHSAKRAVRDFLKDKHGAIDLLNAAWGIRLKSFDDILSQTKLGSDDNLTTAHDKDAFVALIADTFFRVLTESIRKFDPNHIILGCRFAGGNATDAVWAACGKYCDVGTFNYYGSVDLDRRLALGGKSGARMDTPLPEVFADFHKRCGRPLMITEWSFPALDAGLPSTKGAGQRFLTQKERAEATEIWQRAVLRLPFMVGSDYFMWADEPALGIRPEFPENSNYGLVNIDDKPYPLLTAALTRVNERAVKFHAGELAALSLENIKWNAGELSFEVVNQGRLPVEATVTVDAGVRRAQFNATAKPGEAAAGRVALALGPGAHVARIAVNSAQAGPGESDECVRFAPIYVPGLAWPEGAAMRLPLGAANETANPLKEALVVAHWPNAASGLIWSLANAAGKPLNGIAGEEGNTAVAAASIEGLGANRTETICAYGGAGGKNTASAAPQTATSFLRFERNGKGFQASNGALLLASEDSSGSLVSRLQIGDLTIGAYTAMLNLWTGKREFISVDTLEDVQPHWGTGCLALDLVGSYGKRAQPAANRLSLEVCHRLILFPNRPWLVAQLMWARNLGDKPLDVRGWHFRTPSFIRGSASDDFPSTGIAAPRLWKAPQQAAWIDPAGGFLGAVAPPDGAAQVRFWLDPKGGQHPDARWETETTIAPGQTYRPGKPIWLVIAAGDGAETDWARMAKNIATVCGARVYPFDAERRR